MLQSQIVLQTITSDQIVTVEFTLKYFLIRHMIIKMKMERLPRLSFLPSLRSGIRDTLSDCPSLQNSTEDGVQDGRHEQVCEGKYRGRPTPRGSGIWRHGNKESTETYSLFIHSCPTINKCCTSDLFQLGSGIKVILLLIGYEHHLHPVMPVIEILM